MLAQYSQYNTYYEYRVLPGRLNREESLTTRKSPNQIKKTSFIFLQISSRQTDFLLFNLNRSISVFRWAGRKAGRFARCPVCPESFRPEYEIVSPESFLLDPLTENKEDQVKFKIFF